MDNVDWNDLRYLVAVASAGSAAGAARALGVSHATVLRRVQAFERSIGASLFDRLQTGYVPTEPGHRFLELGEAFERALRSAQREVEGHTTGLSGVIRFTTTDSLAYTVMPDVLAGFRQRYPAISVEMRVTNDRLDLEKREADVALRPTGSPPPEWVGRPLARLAMGVYASADYLRTLQDGAKKEYEWLLMEGPLGKRILKEWLRERSGNGTVAAAADSYVVLRQLVMKGLGVTVLPCVVARGAGLTLLERLPDDMTADLWLLTHPDLRYMGRIRAFMDYLTDMLASFGLDEV